MKHLRRMILILHVAGVAMVVNAIIYSMRGRWGFGIYFSFLALVYLWVIKRNQRILKNAS